MQFKKKFFGIVIGMLPIFAQSYKVGKQP